jgi:hypothetical protein
MGHKKSSQNLNFEAKEMILIDKYEAKRVWINNLCRVKRTVWDNVLEKVRTNSSTTH